MTYSYDCGEASRRLTAYSGFLLAAYGTDADGLADIAGVDRVDMAEYIAETDYRKLDAAVLQKLGFLTGISFGWLLAEESCGAPVATASARADGGIDPDEMDEAASRVKACAAVMTALYQQEGESLTYAADLFEMMAAQLHSAARYLDGVLETL